MHNTKPGLRRICLVRLSALGDVCLVIPLVRSLQRALPDARLTWVVGRDAFPIVEELSRVEFVVFDKRSGWREFLRVGKKLKEEAFDVLLALQASFRANLLYPWVRARRKIGFDRRRARDGHGWFVRETIPPARQHFVDAYLSFARVLGVDPGTVIWDLPLRVEDRASVRTLLTGLPRPLCAVNPCASKSERNWPPDCFAELIKQAFRRWSGAVVLTGGSSRSEREIAERLCLLLGPGIPVANLVGRTSLRQLFALLAEADVLISPDSGPVHFANAVGTRVVGLYAAVPAALSGPYHSRHLVVDKFGEAARRFLKREAAELPWNTRVHHPAAMSLITVEEVFERLSAALAEKGFR